MQCLRHAVLLVVLVASFVLVRSGIDDQSPTEDEYAHLTRGIAVWQTGDTRLSYAHPPLANVLATVGLGHAPGVMDVTRSHGWTNRRAATVSMAWLSSDYAGARATLMKARRNMTWIFMAGIAYVYFASLRLFGFRTAVVAILLIAFNPLFVGHARYVTTDLAAAVACTVFTGELARHLGGHSRWATWLTVPLSLGVALLTKHSAVLLVPMFVVVVFVAEVWAARALRLRLPRRAQRARRATVHVLFTAAVAVGVLNVGYAGQDTGLTVAQTLAHREPASWISSPYKGHMLEEVTPLAHLPRALPLPVPYTYLFGVGLIRAQNERGFPQAQFLGERTVHGHVAYFPTMIATKMPLGTLALVLAGLGAALGWRAAPPAAAWVFAAVALGFVGIAMRSNLNMGIRHVLPVLWGLSVLAAVAFGRIWPRLVAHPWLRRSLLLAPCSVVVAGVNAGPDPIGYFNALVGRTRGHAISAVGDDWGQDRAALAELVRRHDLRPLFYDGQTAARRMEAKYLGMAFEDLACRTKLPSGAWAAVHTVTWNNNHHRCWQAIRGRQPVFSVNDHILVFWVP